MTKVDDWVKTEQGLHFCQCGCGGVIHIIYSHHSHGIPNYISGHNNKGKKISPHSDEHNYKISNATTGKNNPMFGKNHSKKTKELMSSAKLGKKGPPRTDEWTQKLIKANTGKKLSVDTKKRISESRIGKYYGKENPNWNGGTSFEPYCYKFNNKLKEHVRNRDNRTCQNCGYKVSGRRLAVHHIHYDKKNCFPDLITLCNSCNVKANTNREYWEEYYMNILESRGLLNWS